MPEHPPHGAWPPAPAGPTESAPGRPMIALEFSYAGQQPLQLPADRAVYDDGIVSDSTRYVLELPADDGVVDKDATHERTL